MAKIRGIKPEFWTDEAIIDLSIPARLLFIGLWNYACDNGHLEDKPKQIKIRLMPGDDVNVAELLRELDKSGRIKRVLGYIEIPTLTEHQKPDRRYWKCCDKPGCVKPEPDSQPESRSGHTVTTPGPPSAPDVGSMGPHVDGDCDGDGDGDLKGSRSRRKRPAKSLPEDWRPTAEHLERAKTEGIDIRAEYEAFRAHAAANDRRQANWNASFTQWLINVPGWKRNQQPPKLRLASNGEPIIPMPKDDVR